MLLRPHPPGFRDNVFTFSTMGCTCGIQVWHWLNDTKTQYWPWKVEFYSPDPQKVFNGFHEGVLTSHHGPLINFAGILTEFKANKYRDLPYTYGRYAFNFNWIRPYRLEFKTEELNGTTTVSGTLSAYLTPGLNRIWTGCQRIFWSSFKR